MTEELVICEIRITDSDSRMKRFEVIMPLKLQSPKFKRKVSKKNGKLEFNARYFPLNLSVSQI